jgi:hypothetical protein
MPCVVPIRLFPWHLSCLAGEFAVLDEQQALSSVTQGNGGLTCPVSTLACATRVQSEHKALAFAKTGLLHLTQLDPVSCGVYVRAVLTVTKGPVVTATRSVRGSRLALGRFFEHYDSMGINSPGEPPDTSWKDIGSSLPPSNTYIYPLTAYVSSRLAISCL